MKSELKKKWLKALRSGKYKQAKGALKRSGDSSPSYCCLGVLCEIYPSGHWEGGTYVYNYNMDDGILPEKLSKQIGLPELIQRRLAGLNDKGSSFYEIADIIEAEL